MTKNRKRKPASFEQSKSGKRTPKPTRKKKRRAIPQAPSPIVEAMTRGVTY